MFNTNYYFHIMKKSKLIITILMLTVSTLVTAQIRGTASYYSNRLHGSATTNGGNYHKDSMTCAHRNFPFGTWLKVKNMRNNKVVIVKVTDRGPHVKGRIIDLSYVAAKKLDFIAQGIAKVEITNLGKDRKVAFEVANDSIKMDSLKMINTIIPDSVK
jgi:rare lipoprotein A